MYTFVLYRPVSCEGYQEVGAGRDSLSSVFVKAACSHRERGGGGGEGGERERERERERES